MNTLEAIALVIFVLALTVLAAECRFERRAKKDILDKKFLRPKR